MASFQAEHVGGFTYYKEFWTYAADGNPNPGITWFPPMLNYSVGTQPINWLNTFCKADGASGRGTELDWQFFYYNIHRGQGSNNYSLVDIGNVYKTAGGAASWSQLVSAAKSNFPGSKGNSWESQGELFGVAQ